MPLNYNLYYITLKCYIWLIFLAIFPWFLAIFDIYWLAIEQKFQQDFRLMAAEKKRRRKIWKFQNGESTALWSVLKWRGREARMQIELMTNESVMTDEAINQRGNTACLTKYETFQFPREIAREATHEEMNCCCCCLLLLLFQKTKTSRK